MAQRNGEQTTKQQCDEATQEGKINWHNIRARYVASDSLTLDELTEELGCALSTIGRRSSAEGWVALRDKRQEDDANAALKQLRRKLRAELVTRTEQHLGAIRGSMAALLMQISRGKDTGLVDADGTPIREPLNANSLDAAARNVIECVRAERMILGEVGDRTETVHSGAVAQDVRFNIDRAREQAPEVCAILDEVGAFNTGEDGASDAIGDVESDDVGEVGPTHADS